MMMKTYVTRDLIILRCVSDRGTGYQVIQLTATDVDTDASLRYRLVEPQIAYDPSGAIVSPNDFDYSVRIMEMCISETGMVLTL